MTEEEIWARSKVIPEEEWVWIMLELRWEREVEKGAPCLRILKNFSVITVLNLEKKVFRKSLNSN
jgi:hypothetical protein